MPVRYDSGEVIPGSRTLQLHWYAVPMVDGGTETLVTSVFFPDAGESYYAPLLTNSSGVAVEEVVNFGRVDQFRCACSIASGSTDVYMGYYQLFFDSVVSAFRIGEYPLGSYRYFSGMSSYWNGQSGAVLLDLTIPPALNRPGDPGVAAAKGDRAGTVAPLARRTLLLVAPAGMPPDAGNLGPGGI